MTKRIAVFIFAGGQSLDITGPIEVFSVANAQSSEAHPDQVPLYDIRLISTQAGPVEMASGVVLLAQVSYESVSAGIDTLLVSGGMGDAVDAVREDSAVLNWLTKMATRVRRIGSVCSGALILAEAGLLDSRTATTHWRDTCELNQRYAKVHVQPDAIYAKDGHIWTSAGITAGMDMALAMVAEDHGMPLALSVAKRLVMVAKRSGGQSQFSQQLSSQTAPPTFNGLVEWLHAHLSDQIDTLTMADQVNMSERNFRRRFAAAFGTTPAKYLVNLRLEAAKQLLENTDADFKRVARDSGFASAEAMRRAFQKNLGINPIEYRQRFGVID